MVITAFEILTAWKPFLITQHTQLHLTWKQIQVITENAQLEKPKDKSYKQTSFPCSFLKVNDRENYLKSPRNKL